jgi:hypothetical protein
MTNFDDVRRKFSNHRQWRDFISAVHESVSYPCSVTYPMVLEAVRSGRAWFSDGAALASSWLNGIKDCGDEFKPERT